MQIMRSGVNCKMPEMKKDKALLLPFSDFKCRSYVAFAGASDEDIYAQFGKVELNKEDGESWFVSELMSEGDFASKCAAVDGDVCSRIRLL